MQIVSTECRGPKNRSKTKIPIICLDLQDLQLHPMVHRTDPICLMLQNNEVGVFQRLPKLVTTVLLCNP